MSKHTQASHNDIGTLAEDAHALMSATADINAANEVCF
jgi:hypothetical protein